MPRHKGQKPRRRKASPTPSHGHLPNPTFDGLKELAAASPKFQQEIPAGPPVRKRLITWPSVLPDPFLSLILFLPAMILPWNTSYIYSPPGFIDPWVYYGYMRHLTTLKAMFPNTYYGSRF